MHRTLRIRLYTSHTIIVLICIIDNNVLPTHVNEQYKSCKYHIHHVLCMYGGICKSFLPSEVTGDSQQLVTGHCVMFSLQRRYNNLGCQLTSVLKKLHKYIPAQFNIQIVRCDENWYSFPTQWNLCIIETLGLLTSVLIIGIPYMGNTWQRKNQ